MHLRWNGIDVSIFVLESLLPFAEEHRLSVTGILAAKLHAKSRVGSLLVPPKRRLAIQARRVDVKAD